MLTRRRRAPRSASFDLLADSCIRVLAPRDRGGRQAWRKRKRNAGGKRVAAARRQEVWMRRDALRFWSASWRSRLGGLGLGAVEGGEARRGVEATAVQWSSRRQERA